MVEPLDQGDGIPQLALRRIKRMDDSITRAVSLHAEENPALLDASHVGESLGQSVVSIPHTHGPSFIAEPCPKPVDNPIITPVGCDAVNRAVAPLPSDAIEDSVRPEEHVCWADAIIRLRTE